MQIGTRARLTVLLVTAGALMALAPHGGLLAPRTQATPVASPEADTLVRRGEEIYAMTCIACHQPAGKGIEGIYPALAGNPFVTLEDPRPVIDVVLTGRGGMPRFGGDYTTDEVAAIVTYLRQAWGNDAAPVSPELVAEVERALAAELEEEEESTTGGGQQPAEDDEDGDGE